MKVGTDGVLLGAWCTLNNSVNSVLDIGSGTGLIALMLAQRSFAELIDAVEIDDNAYEQTVENFEQSSWADRLFCYHSNFKDFAEEMSEDEETYDVIVSNPPFYNGSFKTDHEERNTARFTNALSFTDLIKGVVKILSEEGVFGVIIPKSEFEEFTDIAKTNKLYLNRSCWVKGNPEVDVKRVMLEFSFQQKPVIKEQLIIETERHKYTVDYINLTKDYYLKM
ncbi:MAG: methyltransferase [Flavobacteriaceae bacterium]|nr:methyltransferase [Flavobacteriaceae bacterium]